MKTLKTISLILAVTAILSAFAGCKEENTEKDTSDTTASEVTHSKETTPEENELDPGASKDINYGFDIFDEDHAYCSYSYPSDSRVVISGHYQGKPVTELCSECFFSHDFSGIEKWELEKDGNNNIIEIVLPDTIEYIGDLAFYGCYNLEKINIPANVKEIGIGVFGYCRSLKEINVDKHNPHFKMINKCLVCEDTKEVYAVLPGFVLPEGYDLTESLFDGNNWVQEIVIPNGVHYAHIYDCSSLKNLTFGKDINNIALCCNLPSLEKITVAKGNSEYMVSSGCLIDTSEKLLITVSKGYSVPNDSSVKAVGIWAFEGCDWIKKVTIPDSVTKIVAYNEIYYPDTMYSSIEELNIGAGVSSIDEINDAGNALDVILPTANITVSDKNKVYRFESDCLINSRSSGVVWVHENAVIPNGIKEISCYLRGNYTLTIPKSVKQFCLGVEKTSSLTIHYEGTGDEFREIASVDYETIANNMHTGNASIEVTVICSDSTFTVNTLAVGAC